MQDPVTELDERFSDPAAQATPWATTLKALETAQLFWITTVRADGRPHVTPLVAVWLDDALHFCTGPSEQKALNLSHNPHVVLTTGCNDWTRGLDVMVEGEARRVTDRPTLERLAAAWAAKWTGQWQYEVADTGFVHNEGTAHVLAVKPTKVLAFTKGTFTQTRYTPAS
ncbi:Pyridoxamine 5'-phosphate oxidase [Actinomadura meyerae]|uniref:Pyridoxamine 5'-phosphate oxidase n=1 Tax=Actinomadura meyerae TaxID=240840 RepID=A0A239KKV9_9ACTN|nr:pyridoxamine 5'-phosphate oxidase family protein [Actinomadura meyerae]SNT18801.1 Pyridoxamine 5'-phosphate oxidase [Actinomadura meyerae]